MVWKKIKKRRTKRNKKIKIKYLFISFPPLILSVFLLLLLLFVRVQRTCQSTYVQSFLFCFILYERELCSGDWDDVKTCLDEIINIQTTSRRFKNMWWWWVATGCETALGRFGKFLDFTGVVFSQAEHETDAYSLSNNRNLSILLKLKKKTP